MPNSLILEESIIEKNEKPTIDYRIQEATTNSYTQHTHKLHIEADLNEWK